jgi:6-pyruvoyltetrahydropterin/6-carboxytetrahydropterin synthase
MNKINHTFDILYELFQHTIDSMVFLTRRENFSAAHKLYREEWSTEKNENVFGKCSNPNWHGHNYELYVTVKGEMNPETGFVIDLKILGELIRRRVVDKMDHKNINLEVDFMKGKMASTEQIAMGIWEQLDVSIRALGAELHCVKLCETENNFIEYFGS